MAGIANEENPVVFANLATTNYFQFIGNDEPNMGRLDSLLPLPMIPFFLADLTSTGNTDASVNSGVIYPGQIAGSPRALVKRKPKQPDMSWSRGGVLQQAGAV